MATQKKYIGNGKSTVHNGITVSIRLEDAQPYARTSKSGTWLNFMVAERKAVDEFGRTHSAFVLVDAPEAQPAPAVMAEPAPSMETPVGAKVKKNGRNLARISKEEAAAKRAALADMQA